MQKLFVILFLVKLISSPFVLKSDGEDVQASMAYIIYYAFDFIVIIGFFWLNTIKGWHKAVKWMALLILLSGVTAAVNGTSLYESINYLSRIWSPILLFWIAVEYPEYRIENSYIFKIMLSTLILICIAIIFMEDSYNRFEYWWPSYFGGVHTTAYTFAIVTLFFGYLMYSRRNFICAALIYGFGVYAIFFGWGVRTSLVFMISIILMLSTTKIDQKNRWVAIPILMLFVIIYIFNVDYYEMNLISSGRLDMYAEKLDIINARGWLQNLIGSGAGSDLIETSFWSNEKGSHNDFLTVFIELGMVGLILMSMIFGMLYKSLKFADLKIIFSCALIASLMSNGILVRPVPFYLMILLFIYIQNNKRIQK